MRAHPLVYLSNIWRASFYPSTAVPAGCGLQRTTTTAGDKHLYYFPPQHLVVSKQHPPAPLL